MALSIVILNPMVGAYRLKSRALLKDGGAYFELVRGEGGGGAYKRAPWALTCRGSGNICKIILSSIFSLKLGWIKPPPSSPGSDVPAAVES